MLIVRVSYASNNGMRSGATVRTVSGSSFAKWRSVTTRLKARANPGPAAKGCIAR
jgi:hypothetical protein